MYDLKVRGGTLVDGTGGPAFVGDLGIRDGRIVDVGDARESGARTIDARGRIVSPGFIDNHTHYDAQVLWDPMLSHSPWHGVTTVLFGNCGVGFAPCREKDREFMMRMCELVEGIPFDCLVKGMGDWGFETFPQYLDVIERKGIAVNCAVNLAHHPLKVYVQGQDAADRFPSDGEMDTQCDLLLEALKAGASGFSIFNGIAHWGPGGKPVPSRLTFPRQYEQFIQVIHDFGCGNMEVNVGPAFNSRTAWRLVRQYDVTFDHIPSDWDVAAELVRDGGRWYPHISMPGTGSFEVSLEDPFMFAIDTANLVATSLHELFDNLATPEQRLAAYRDPEFRRRFIEATDDARWVENYWPALVVSYYPPDPSHEGQPIVDMARAAGVSPGEFMLDEAIESNLQARWLITDRIAEVFGLSEERIFEAWLHNPAVRIGNGDAGAHQGQLAGYRWPTAMLAHYARDKGFPLERAIQLMTQSMATAMGLADRGTLTPGSAGDLVVFDYDRIEPGPISRINDLPHGARRLFSDARGIDYVVVNGNIIRDHGNTVVDFDHLPGRLLRDFLPNSVRQTPAVAGAQS
jgi:N-acyl-D-aspartate/D-glutamate deacylase